MSDDKMTTNIVASVARPLLLLTIALATVIPGLFLFVQRSNQSTRADVKGTQHRKTMCKEISKMLTI